MRVEAATAEDLAWLCQRAGCVLTGNAKGVAVKDSQGRTRGVVGYDGWTPNSVQCHMAVNTPVAWRALLRPAFAYPFEEAGRRVILAVIPAGNVRSVHLAKRFGLRETHRVRDGWAPGEDLVLLEMRAEECPWLRQRKAA